MIDAPHQASSAFSRTPAARVTAPSSRRRGPGSTPHGQRSRDRVLQASLELITEVGIDRVRLAEIAGPWRQLERFTDLYLPSGPADPAWILWTEAWARAPHDAEMSGFLDELMRPWYEDLAEIVQRGVQEGIFGLRLPSGDFTICFCALLDGLAMIHMHQKPYLPRERLVELAMATARAHLTPAVPGDAE